MLFSNNSGGNNCLIKQKSNKKQQKDTKRYKDKYANSWAPFPHLVSPLVTVLSHG